RSQNASRMSSSLWRSWCGFRLFLLSQDLVENIANRILLLLLLRLGNPFIARLFLLVLATELVQHTFDSPWLTRLVSEQSSEILARRQDVLQFQLRHLLKVRSYFGMLKGPSHSNRQH